MSNTDSLTPSTFISDMTDPMAFNRFAVCTIDGSINGAVLDRLTGEVVAEDPKFAPWVAKRLNDFNKNHLTGMGRLPAAKRPWSDAGIRSAAARLLSGAAR